MYAGRAVWAIWRHRIFDLAPELPGRDDVVLARAPITRFAVIRNPEYARHVLLANQNNDVKSDDYELLAVAFGRGLVTELLPQDPVRRENTFTGGPEGTLWMRLSKRVHSPREVLGSR